MKLLIGSNKINPTIGGNVIDENFKKFAVDKQLDNISKILGGEVKHYYVSDRTSQHEKIVIEYNHTKK